MPLCVKIVIVEDDPELLLMYQELLIGEGYQVDCISDGLTALEKFADSTNASLILLDIMLPHVTGIDILSTIKSPTNPNHKIPVIMLSNIKNPKVQKQTQKLGCAAFIQKADENPQEFLDIIKTHILSPPSKSKLHKS